MTTESTACLNIHEYNINSSACVGSRISFLRYCGIFAQSKTCESQQPAVTRQLSVNNRGMVYSAQSVPMAAHKTMEYIMPSLSKNCTAIFYAVRAEMLLAGQVRSCS
jgi:hypothetical protein